MAERIRFPFFLLCGFIPTGISVTATAGLAVGLAGGGDLAGRGEPPPLLEGHPRRRTPRSCRTPGSAARVVASIQKLRCCPGKRASVVRPRQRAPPSRSTKRHAPVRPERHLCSRLSAGPRPPHERSDLAEPRAVARERRCMHGSAPYGVASWSRIRGPAKGHCASSSLYEKIGRGLCLTGATASSSSARCMHVKASSPLPWKAGVQPHAICRAAFPISFLIALACSPTAVYGRPCRRRDVAIRAGRRG